MSPTRQILRAVKWIFVFLLGYFIFVEVVVRIIRRYYHFPVPGFIVPLIDNPIRRRIQPPDQIAGWMGVEMGMQVLEVGPGPGTFTFAVARRAGENGHVNAIDIQESIITALNEKISRLGFTNVSARQASVYELPFPDQFFDRIFMIAVLGEIPDKELALSEFKRVLKSDGTLAIGEFLPDPDYPLKKTIVNWCEGSGFHFSAGYGNWLHYLLLFRKQENMNMRA